MKIQKSLQFLLGILVTLSVVLAACGPSQYIVGSELICPLPYNPATDLSKCTVAQSQGETYDATIKQKFVAVLLDDQHVAIYQKDSENYDIVRGRGYFPIPNDYARIYPTTPQGVISNVEPANCGGENGISCLNALDGVVMSGPTVFDSSYEFFYTLDFSDRTKYKEMYEAVTVTGLKGFDAYMFTYNDTLRDVLRELNTIDPAPWLSGEKSKSDIEPIWLEIIATHPKLEPYRTTVKIDSKTFRCRYFDVPKTDADQTSQGQADTEFQRHLADLATYCEDFQTGSSCYIECMRVYECYASGGSCTFGGPVMACGATVPADLTPTPNP